jgi:gamma-glutamyltranspeptidase/glutathione hydrolase
MPMREIVAPAVELARDGVRLNTLQAYIFRIVERIYTWSPEARAIFGSSRAPTRMVGECELLRQPELAEVFEALAVEGDELFYRGEIAREITAQCRESGGCLTPEDLAGYEVVRREPLSVDYRDVRLLTNPPPSSGGVLVAFALRLLDGITELRGVRFGSREYLQLIALVLEMTNQARVDAHLDESTAHPDAEQLLDEQLLDRYREEIKGRARATRGTTHMNVMDARGNVATLTVSNGEGCGYIVPGTGIMLNNMLGEEDLNPHGFHCWQTDQRMTSMMSPSIVRWRDGRVVATGSGGSKRIRTALLQLIVNLVDYGMTVEDAVAGPRIFIEDGLLSIEGGFDRDEVMRLLQDYPKHQVWNELNLYFGGAHTVERDGDAFRGAGDPRRGGVCVVVD